MAYSADIPGRPAPPFLEGKWRSGSWTEGGGGGGTAISGGRGNRGWKAMYVKNKN